MFRALSRRSWFVLFSEAAVAERKNFLLRIDPAILDSIQQWAADDLRSLNGQIEFILRKALTESARYRAAIPASDKREPEKSGGST